MQKVYDLTFTHHAPRATAQHVDELRRRGAGGRRRWGATKSANVLCCLRVWLAHYTFYAGRGSGSLTDSLGGLTSPQTPMPNPSQTTPPSPVTATYFITAKLVFECKTKRGDSANRGFFTAPRYMCYEMFPQKRNQFNKIMENVKMLRGRLRQGKIRPKRRRRRFPVALHGRSIGPLSCPGPIMGSETSRRPNWEQWTVSDTSTSRRTLMEPIFQQVILIIGTCFVFRNCAST